MFISSATTPSVTTAVANMTSKNARFGRAGRTGGVGGDAAGGPGGAGGVSRFSVIIVSPGSRPRSMPHVVVAVNAAHRILPARAAADDLMHEFAMTLQTALLKDRRVRRLDHDRLMKILQRKTLAVVPAIARLGQ